MATATVCLFFLACALLGADALHVIPRAAEDDNTTESPTQCTVKVADQNCYNGPVRNFFKRKSIIEMTDSDQLDKRCRAHEKVKACMRSFLEDCGSDVSIDNHTRAIDYVCGEGREALLSLRSCRRIEKVAHLMKKCTNIAKHHKAYYFPTTIYESKLCEILDELRKCATSAVERKCKNPDATKFVNTMYTLFNAPDKQAVGCDNDDDSTVEREAASVAVSET